ncbi:MAG: recombinase family protein [Deltaproteobacteria bacterium]|nr:recombinase family protein [Deltaproteobacteria bacterium]
MAIYLRVSDNDALALQEQQERVLEGVKQLGWTVVKIYIDLNRKGHTWDRPALKDLRRDASIEPRPFDAIIVWSVDRLARSKVVMADLWSFIRARQIHLVSLVSVEGVNTLTSSARDPWDRRAAPYRHAMERAEKAATVRDHASEKELQRVKTLRESGDPKLMKKIGGRRPCMGVRKRREVVRRARQMVNTGQVTSLEQAAPALGISKSTLYRWAAAFPRSGRTPVKVPTRSR